MPSYETDDFFTYMLNSKNSLDKNFWHTFNRTDKPEIFSKVPHYNLNTTFFKIKEYTLVESANILDWVTTAPSSFIFDKYGNIFSTANTGFGVHAYPPDKWKTHTYRNPLVSKMDFQSPDLNIGNRESNTANTSSSHFTVGNGKKISSNDHQYILSYNEKGTYSLLYNPIHRERFKNLFTQLNKEPQKYPQNQRLLRKIFWTYCNGTSGERQGREGNPKYDYFADQTCNCFAPTDATITKTTTGFNEGNRSTYNAFFLSNNSIYPKDQVPTQLLPDLDKIAICTAPGCMEKKTITPNSFLHSYWDDQVDKSGGCDKAIAITVCNNTVAAGGNIDMNNNQWNTTCGKDSDYYQRKEQIIADGKAAEEHKKNKDARERRAKSEKDAKDAIDRGDAFIAKQKRDALIKNISIGVGSLVGFLILLKIIWEIRKKYR